jgi:putative spermidine/putrescine transport system permease protein
MFTFLVSWTQYITTVLVGGGQIVTLPMVLFPLIGAANHAVAAAVSIIFVAPALLILILTTRFVHSDIHALGGMGRL